MRLNVSADWLLVGGTKGPLRDDEIERIYKQGATDCLNGIVADLEETLFGKEGKETTP
jgi:hypothetical protein